MDRIVTSRLKERECNAADEQPPQLLDSPLPTPRRSCASIDAARLRCRRDASPLRTQVPFSWESSPGVPKKSATCRDAQEELMPPPPRPPPGRLQPPCPARNWYYVNTSEASTDDEDDDRSFSDALDRISSPDRIGSFDRTTSKRFEDIFVGRATSFASKDRSGSRARAAVDGIDNAGSGRRHPPRQWRRGSMRRWREEEVWIPPQRISDPRPMQLMQRIRMDAEAEEMSPRACGLMVFFPWSPKPAVCGFRTPSQSQHATPRARAADAPAAPSSSRSRRGKGTTTLRDAIKQETEAGSTGFSPPQRGEKRSRDREPWGVSSLLDTSKKYCTDARKALSKLSIGRGASDSGSPRVSSDKLPSRFSTLPTTGSKATQLKQILR